MYTARQSRARHSVGARFSSHPWLGKWPPSSLMRSRKPPVVCIVAPLNINISTAGQPFTKADRQLQFNGNDTSPNNICTSNAVATSLFTKCAGRSSVESFVERNRNRFETVRPRRYPRVRWTGHQTTDHSGVQGMTTWVILYSSNLKGDYHPTELRCIQSSRLAES